MTAHKATPLHQPDRPWIPLQRHIIGQQYKSLDRRLRNQQPVERVSVNQRQGVHLNRWWRMDKKSPSTNRRAIEAHHENSREQPGVRRRWSAVHKHLCGGKGDNRRTPGCSLDASDVLPQKREPIHAWPEDIDAHVRQFRGPAGADQSTPEASAYYKLV